MRWWLTLFFLILQITAWAEQGLILKNVPPEIQQELMEQFPEIRAGDVPAPVIDNAIRFLVDKNVFDAVRAETDARGQLSIVVELRRLVGEINFKGDRSLPWRDLKNALKIQSGDRFDRSLAIESGENLKRIYGEAGYFNAIVDIGFEQQPDGTVNVTYTIDEKVPCRIRAIDISSHNQELRDRLSSEVRRFNGYRLTQENLDRMVKEIHGFLSDRFYLTASIKDPQITYNEEKTRATIELEIQDPYKWQFNISGNKEKNLSEIYTMLDLTNRERKNIDPVAESIDRLRRYYLKEGFPHVDVKSRSVKLESQFIIRVFLTIDEGPRVVIDKYRIEGRISRPESYYTDFIERHSSSIIGKGYYNREDLDAGLENLVTHLKNEGFLRARVQSLRAEFSKDQSKATVFVNLDEGSLTQIRSISFEGNNFFSDRELTSVFGLEARSPLRLLELEEGIEKIKEFYRSQGFIEMRILNEDETLVSYNPKGTLAEVNFKIYEGPRVRIADIVIDGNSFTKEYVIRQEADFQLGQIITPQAVNDALDRLNRLGIFSRVDIRTLEEGTAIADRTLIITVAERDPGVFRMGAGVNSERTFTARGFVGIGYNNLWGTARAVSARAELNYNIAEINYPEYEISFGYLEPFLFNSRTKGRINLTRSERIFEYDSGNDGLTSLTLSERADFLIERQFTKALRTSFKVWSIDRRKDFEAHGRCLEPPDPTKKCPSATQQIGKIGPIIDLDYRDNPFLPTKGSFSRAIFEYSDPVLGSSQGIHFLKADAQYSKYIRLGSPRLIWANSIRGGYLKNLDGSPGSGIPANQAFFLGGTFTVRGFDATRGNERIPPEWEVPVPRSTSIVVSDYSYYGLFKSELRFPIYGDHGGVIFYDGGLVQIMGEINNSPVHISRPYRDAVGFGYRYNTPVGPVSLDFAFKIDPRTKKGEQEDLFRVHFSIGTF